MKLKKIAASIVAAAVAFSAFAFSAFAEETKDDKLTLMSADLTADLKTNMVFVEGVGVVDITGADFDSSENGSADEDANLDVDFDGIAYLSKENLKNWKETGVLELSKLKADFDTAGLKWGMFNAQNGYVQLVKMEKQKVEGSDEEENVVTYRGLYKIENDEIKYLCDLGTFWTYTRPDGVSVGFEKEYATIHHKEISSDYETGEIKTTEYDVKYLVGLKMVVTQPDGTKKGTTIAKAPLKDMNVTIDRTDENFDWEKYFSQYDGLYYYSNYTWSYGVGGDGTPYASLGLEDGFEVLDNDLGFEIYECDVDGNVKKIFEANDEHRAGHYGTAYRLGDIYCWCESGAPVMASWNNICFYNSVTKELKTYDYEDPWSNKDAMTFFYPHYAFNGEYLVGEVYTANTEDGWSESSRGYAIFKNVEDLKNNAEKTKYKKITPYAIDVDDDNTVFICKYVTKDDKIGYMDADENVLAEFDATDGFAGKYAPVVKDGKAYLINGDMNAVSTEIEAEDVVAVTEDLFLAKKGDKTYFVTYGGEVDDPATEVVVVDYTDNGVTASANEGVIADGAALSVKAVEDKTDETKVTYEISFKKADGTTVQPNGTVTVKIPVPEAFKDKTIYVYRVEADGKYTDMNAKVENGLVVFETDHFSEYVLTIEKQGEQPAETTDTSTDSNSGGTTSPETGAAGLPITLGVLAIASAAVVISRKKR